MPIEASIENSKGPYDNVLLVTIHGVNSDNGGFEEFGTLCKKELPGLKVFNANYNSIHPFWVLSPKARGLIYESVRLNLATVHNHTQQAGIYENVKKIVVAAHSLGTLAFYEYLTRPLLPKLDMKFYSVVLSGSILPRKLDWSYWTTQKVINTRPVNIVRPFDLVAKWGTFYSSDNSLSGTRGFTAIGDMDSSVINTYKRGGHTSYWKEDVKEVVQMVKIGNIEEIRVSRDDFISTLNTTQRWRLRGYSLLQLR